MAIVSIPSLKKGNRKTQDCRYIDHCYYKEHLYIIFRAITLAQPLLIENVSDKSGIGEEADEKNKEKLL